MINLNNTAALCAENAKNRGKVGYDVSHILTWWSISNELKEFYGASETGPSEHIPEYTEAQEELADILITCLTELHRRNVDIEAIITKKLEFNQNRK